MDLLTVKLKSPERSFLDDYDVQETTIIPNTFHLAKEISYEDESKINCCKTFSLRELEWQSKSVGYMRKFRVSSSVNSRGWGRLSPELPIKQYRGKITEILKRNDVLIVIGETGSGKSTQIPQYLLEDGFADDGYTVCVTQPRRLAATALSKRVCEEMGTRLGETVGYSIRFDQKFNKQTKLKYVTEGILLNEYVKDPTLEDYSVIMIDEAHERSRNCDVLLGLLKQKIKMKKNCFKLIISSATLEAEKISRFYDGAPILEVEGRNFPIEILFSETTICEYYEASLKMVEYIHKTEPAGSILVFLTSQDEVEGGCMELQHRMKDDEVKVLGIHGGMQQINQSEIFERVEGDRRKIILATNIAETSVTIDDVRYVIDCGFAKNKKYIARKRIETLQVEEISKAQAKQRCGRAGRTAAGKCFRLYTKEKYLKMKNSREPEILSSNMESIVLTLKMMDLDPMTFSFVDSPNTRNTFVALKELYDLRALDKHGNVTQLGREMSKYPLEPKMAKMLVMSMKYKCTEEIAIIIGMSTETKIFCRPKKDQRLADMMKKKFQSNVSDSLTLLNVYVSWVESNHSQDWCYKNFINNQAINTAHLVIGQLKGMVGVDNDDMKVSKPLDDVPIRKCIASAFFNNVCCRSGTSHMFLELSRVSNYSTTKLYIHPSSSLFSNCSVLCVVYENVTQTKKEYLRGCTQIKAPWLVELAPHKFEHKDIDTITAQMDYLTMDDFPLKLLGN
ncbi:hypothetical protein SNEBB_004441 [Seison nebaliae]|nr:hypothetical protein SNEBB_004441 [Seison nebaliae]